MGAPVFDVIRAEQEVEIAAPVARVWSAITERIGEWWPRAYLGDPDAIRLVLEPTPGGRLYEEWGPGEGLLWGTVLAVRRNRKLQIAGELTPEFGGPARLVTTYALEPSGKGTRLRVTELAYGGATEKTGRSLADGGKKLLHDHLKPFAER